MRFEYIRVVRESRERGLDRAFCEVCGERFSTWSQVGCARRPHAQGHNLKFKGTRDGYPDERIQEFQNNDKGPEADGKVIQAKEDVAGSYRQCEGGCILLGGGGNEKCGHREHHLYGSAEVIAWPITSYFLPFTNNLLFAKTQTVLVHACLQELHMSRSDWLLTVRKRKLVLAFTGHCRTLLV